MTETLYDYPCSETFRDHELWWQGEGLYSEPRERLPIEQPPAQDFYLLDRLDDLQLQIESLKKTSHSHSYKKSTKYIVEG